ncbi:MAG: hypothetical protein NWE89_13300 [Candidatus Bathyarchaeota archaeon]|nr:hypothetical protein [Candidatus Bathyarchaeota archaeon]
MSDKETDLRELNEKLEIMLKRLDYLEAVLTESRQYPEIAQLMGALRVGAGLYTEPLKLIQRLISVRRHLSRDVDHRDEVSRIILNVLAVKGPQNISGLTREVQRERGTGSRVTVRKKILELVEEEIIEKDEGHCYRLVE